MLMRRRIRVMAKKNYGNGRAFKRGHRWWISYYADGAERRESCGPGVSTKGAAQRMLRERLHAVDMGLAGPALTVGALLDLFISDQHNQARKAARDAETRANRIRAALGEKRVADVTPRHVARLVEKLRTANCSGPTINRYRAVWQRAFHLGSQAGLKVLAPYWPRHAESPPKRDYVTLERFEAILSELSEPYRTVALAAFWTACRQGEIRNWRWEHVDLNARMVLLPDTKSGPPRRVPLAEPIWAALVGLNMRAQRDWPGCPWVFTLDGHKGLSIWALRSAWVRACERSGIAIRFHGLRHTAVTNYRSAGVEEGAIMAISGHKTRSVFDRYGIQPEAKLREATSKLEEAMRTKGGQRIDSAPSVPTGNRVV